MFGSLLQLPPTPARSVRVSAEEILQGPAPNHVPFCFGRFHGIGHKVPSLIRLIQYQHDYFIHNPTVRVLVAGLIWMLYSL
jgi:hypothetical protein